MAHITIERRRTYADAIRRYRVFLNGRQHGEIRQGEVVNLSVPAGRYDVVLKIDWCSSQTLTVSVAEEETAALMCGPNRILPWGALAMLLVPNRWIDLRQKLAA
jgi:hypothetical protein